MAGKAAQVAAVIAEIRAFCLENADETQARRYARFFTEGYDAYGIPKETWEAKRICFYEKYRNQMKLEDFLDMGDILFESGKYEEGSFAIVAVTQAAEQMTSQAFRRIGNWLERGVRNWAHTDVLCGEVFGPCLKNKLVPLSEIAEWRRSKSKWMRRAVPVSLLALLGGPGKIGPLLKFVEPLMLDGERVVHQGLGWFLREAWKKDPAPVETMLLKWKEKAPRLIFQYATEKMTAAQKKRFRKSKR